MLLKELKNEKLEAVIERALRIISRSMETPHMSKAKTGEILAYKYKGSWILMLNNWNTNTLKAMARIVKQRFYTLDIKPIGGGLLVEGYVTTTTNPKEVALELLLKIKINGVKNA